MQILFDSNLRQADVVFNRVIKEMHNLQEFCVGFRSLLDFFEHSRGPRDWWVERICQVRGLRKFDLRFEDESFPPSLWTLHYSKDGLRRQLGACIQVLKQICQRSVSDQDATCQNRYINRLSGVELYEVVYEMIDQILMGSDKVNESDDDEVNESDDDELDDSEVDEFDDDGQSDIEEVRGSKPGEGDIGRSQVAASGHCRPATNTVRSGVQSQCCEDAGVAQGDS